MNIKTTPIGETEKLDSEGTYKTYVHIESEDGEPLDIPALQEEAYARYCYRGHPGAYFCSRVTVWPHPYLKYQAIIEAIHQLDI